MVPLLTYDARCSGDRLSPLTRYTTFTRPLRRLDSTGSFRFPRVVWVSVPTATPSRLGFKTLPWSISRAGRP